MSDYRMSHQPDLAGPGIHEADKTYPGIHDNPRWYATGDACCDAESMSVISQTRGRPDHTVRVYRAVPHGVTDINPGDWVSTSRTYAQQHGRHPEDPAQDMPVISKTVRARNLVEGSGNSIHEWGYQP
jgi:hypothetical protein